jgi:hypothetical protein
MLLMTVKTAAEELSRQLPVCCMHRIRAWSQVKGRLLRVNWLVLKPEAPGYVEACCQPFPVWVSQVKDALGSFDATVNEADPLITVEAEEGWVEKLPQTFKMAGAVVSPQVPEETRQR